jgi:hypothetical protein
MSVDLQSWRLFGRSAFLVRGRITPPSVCVTTAEARTTVAQRLQDELARLADDDRDAALGAAVEGYLESHRRLGGRVE